MMAVSIQAGTPLAEQLSNIVQPKLVDVGWSSGGLDDSALAEYIILMLVNGKTQEQIASELSNDLLNLGPDDSNATEFARWLFEQVDILTNQQSGSSMQSSSFTNEPQTQAIPSFTTESGASSGTSSHQLASQDTDMEDALSGVQDPNM